MGIENYVFYVNRVLEGSLKHIKTYDYFISQFKQGIGGFFKAHYNI